MNLLKRSLSYIVNKVNGFLFPIIEESLGELTSNQKKLVQILELVKIEELVKFSHGAGRPPKYRIEIARSFVAKAVYNMPTTRALIERLKTDSTLRWICGWTHMDAVPEECLFSRAFAEFAEYRLPEVVHDALIKESYSEQLVGHLSRDSSEIIAREKPEKPEKKDTNETPKKVYPRGRPKKDEVRPAPEPTRIERQQTMTQEQMLEDLEKFCNAGCKTNSKGYKETWIGYKLHADCIDGQVPVSCILTSASVHDSQVAIPLSVMSSKKVTNLYDLMDSAYDSEGIKNFSKKLNHVPIIDSNKRKGDKKRFDPATKERYKERTAIERVFGRLKDEFGGRMVRVRGNKKVFAHLMFGILALTADQLLRLAA